MNIKPLQLRDLSPMPQNEYHEEMRKYEREIPTELMMFLTHPVPIIYKQEGILAEIDSLTNNND